MVWAIHTFQGSNAVGTPNKLYGDWRWDTKAALELYQQTNWKRSLNSFDWWKPIEGIDENDLQRKIAALNGVYFAGTNAQTQDRGYSNPDAPTTTIFKPNVEQVQAKLDEGYNPAQIADLIVNRPKYVTPIEKEIGVKQPMPPKKESNTAIIIFAVMAVIFLYVMLGRKK